MIDSATPAGIRVSLLLFARYAELLGTDRVDLDLPVDATVGDVLSAARALPGGASLPASLFVALNLEQVDLGASVEDGDEVALLPPMAGG